MLIQPVLRPVLQPVLRSIFDPGIGGGGTPIRTPASLFAKYSAAGGMWDFTDMATLFQDSARTVPVTAASQPVGGVNDISGLHRVLVQPTNAARPQFNGAGITFDSVVNTIYSADNIAITGDKVTLAMRYTNTQTGYIRIVDFGADVLGSTKGVGHYVGYSASSDLCFIGRGSGLRAAAHNTTPTTGDRIVSCVFDIAGSPEIVGRRNGADLAFNYGYGDMGGGNFEPAVFRISNAAAGGTAFFGTVSRVVIIGASLTASDMLVVEAWLGEAP